MFGFDSHAFALHSRTDQNKTPMLRFSVPAVFGPAGGLQGVQIPVLQRKEQITPRPDRSH